MSLEICEHCGQPIKQAHKEQLNKHKLTILQRVAKRIIETQRNDFDLHELVDNYNDYNNFQKLRYHGLIHHVTDSAGQKVRGHWLITLNGWAFLRGEINLPKFVIVKLNRIVEKSEETFNVRDVYYGSEVVATTFEYFDDNGHMVGVRPNNSKENPNQARLL